MTRLDFPFPQIATGDLDVPIVGQLPGMAPAQVPGAKTSVCHGVGGMFAASGTIIMSNEPP
jgi:hypothetical protein